VATFSDGKQTWDLSQLETHRTIEAADVFLGLAIDLVGHSKALLGALHELASHEDWRQAQQSLTSAISSISHLLKSGARL
jgi:hypothetical protein